MENIYDNDENGGFAYPNEYGESNAMKALREKAEADSKKIAELESNLAKLVKQNEKREVAQMFSANGLDGGLSKFYRGEADAEKVNEWIQENAKYFRSQPDEGNSAQEVHSGPETTVDQSTAQQFQQMQQASTGGFNEANDQAAVTALNSANSVEELYAAMRQNGFNGAAPF